MKKSKESLSASPDRRPASSHYIYPHSITLKNKYGIREVETFNKRYEHDLKREMINLHREPLPEKIDSTYLKYIHQYLFQGIFEWAGMTRNLPFVFEDGSVAFMPIIARSDQTAAFAEGDEIQDGLDKLDQMLAEKNSLQNLSREDFINNAAQMFALLNHIRPFREGNEPAQQMFFEKLAKFAGYKLDFSLVTQARIENANVAVARYNYFAPMKHMFEDISDPFKAAALKESMNCIHYIERKNINDCIIMSAKEGNTYRGTYRGYGAKSFTINVNDTYIVSHVDHLTPEQRKTLNIGDSVTFTVPNAEDLKKILIPKENLAPLTKNEIVTKITENTFVQKSQREVCRLSELVYGNSKALSEQMKLVHTNPSFGEQIVEQIVRSPSSISKIAGISFLGIKSAAHKEAESNIIQLSAAFENFTDTVKYAKKRIDEKHQIEQQRRGQMVEVPSKMVQCVLSLPKRIQQKTLVSSPLLREELCDFIEKVNSRLSSSERQAIHDKNYAKLMHSIGISEHKAKEITTTVTQAKKAHQLAQTLQINRSKSEAQLLIHVPKMNRSQSMDMVI
ncbi:BID domain-containing T4SS effector [Bartonella sp. cb54]|uniref:BID domain-containing T4SS effector n=1 Tax=Bartonella sp. cb54 TaxID=3385560 RepID=UPI0039A78751